MFHAACPFAGIWTVDEAPTKFPMQVVIDLDFCLSLPIFLRNAPVRNRCWPVWVYAQGTTTIPILPACATTLLTMPCSESPDSLVSLVLIFAISKTCFRLTFPTTPTALLPGELAPGWVDVFPWPSMPLVFFGPGVLPAPRTLFFTVFTPAAAMRRDAVGGVRSSKVNDRSGRTVTRAGIGVPGT